MGGEVRTKGGSPPPPPPPPLGAAQAKAEGSLRYFLTSSAWEKVKSVAQATASRFWKARSRLYGTEATQGLPSSMETAATFLAPFLKRLTMSSLEMARTAGSKREPLS